MRHTLLAATSTLAVVAAMPAAAQSHFNRVASFPVALNLPADADPATETSAEIIAVSGDGMTLAYSDSPNNAVGFIDITDARAPAPLGRLAFDGEPTAVSIAGATAFVAINTSVSFTEPSGRLASVDLATREETASCDLGGQPDSTAIAPDGSFIAIAIENERDEDAGDGGLPQMPAGFVAIVPLADGAMDCDGLIRADVTGIAEVAPEDPEPEFVDVNDAGEIVVTLQENNHIVILGPDGAVRSHFSAGAVDLEGIDATEDGALVFTESQPGRLREPDGIQWIDADHIATANEGDWNGGSRGFTIFRRDGTVAWESGAAFEQAIVEIGHYPEGRSDAKGVEPEGMEFARFGETDFLFVLSERGSIIGVYRVEDGEPVLHQLLPSGVSPEGVIAIPERNLLATANEVDLVADGLARAHVMIFELQDAPAAYPSITSAGADERIGWGALSGLAADAEAPGRLYAVNDSFYGMQPTIFAIDASAMPARITDAIPVTRFGQPAQKLDIEGIALDGEGGFWLASEGRSDRLIPHALYRVDAAGAITEEIPFPAELLAGETRFGAEGITVIGDRLWIAMQREWGDDPAGHVKLVAYDPAEGYLGRRALSARSGRDRLDRPVGDYRARRSRLHPRARQPDRRKRADQAARARRHRRPRARTARRRAAGCHEGGDPRLPARSGGDQRLCRRQDRGLRDRCRGLRLRGHRQRRRRRQLGRDPLPAARLDRGDVSKTPEGAGNGTLGQGPTAGG
jgi:hypothetical protein